MRQEALAAKSDFLVGLVAGSIADGVFILRLAAGGLWFAKTSQRKTRP